MSSPRLLSDAHTMKYKSTWRPTFSEPLHFKRSVAGADPGGGGAPPPPKIGKNMMFWHKIVIFHTKYLKNVRTSLRNWKKYDFLA